MKTTYKINKKDYQKYKNREQGNKLTLIWSDMVVSLKEERLRREAKEKWFNVVERNSQNQSLLQFEIPGASDRLSRRLNKINTVVLVG